MARPAVAASDRAMPAAAAAGRVDTATVAAVVALGALDGTLLAADAWEAGHRHAEELLARIADAPRAAPGSGGRARDRSPASSWGPARAASPASAWASPRRAGSRAPPAPRSSACRRARALEAAARAGAGPAAARRRGPPAGRAPRDATSSATARPRPGPAAGVGEDPPPPGAVLVAVDLAGRARRRRRGARGRALEAGLAAALVALGCARLRAGADDGATLAPEYVTLPRGVAAAAGEVAWSPARP